MVEVTGFKIKIQNLQKNMLYYHLKPPLDKVSFNI